MTLKFLHGQRHHERPKGTQEMGAPNKTGVGPQENLQFSANKSPYLRNGVRQDRCHYDGLIESCICVFDWYQNHRHWMTLNDRYVLYCSKDASFGVHRKILNEIRPMLSAAKMQAKDSATAIFGDLCGYFSGNIRHKASNIIQRYATLVGL